MSMPVAECGFPVNFTSTQAVSTGPCQLIGFYVNSTSGGTLVIKDGTASTGAAISGTITPGVGFHAFPADCGIACYATIAVAALNVTFFFAAAN